MDLGTNQKSRRAVLAAVGGAAAAVAAQALGRPLPALADGETVKVGQVHGNAMSPTVIRNRVNDEEVFVARSDGEGVALVGRSASGTGVFGNGGTGVFANGGTGVFANGNIAIEAVGQRFGVHVRADGDGATGLYSSVSGESAIAIEAHSELGPGVVGHTSSESATGVVGAGPTTGIYGWSVNGTGIVGESHFGVAVRAVGIQGIGLEVERGRVKLAQVSGVAIIDAGRRTVTIDPGVDVVPRAFVLLTPRANLIGRDLWYTTAPEADTFTIHMSEPRSNRTPIAWLLVG